jgi:hypothetical protein
MTNIDQLLPQVGGYFKGKLLNGEYTVVAIGENTAKLRFDDKYEFKVWIANEPRINFDFYLDFFGSPLTDSFKFDNDQDRIDAYNKLKPHLDKYKQDVLISSKKYQLEKLQKELSELEKEEQ